LFGSDSRGKIAGIALRSMAGDGTITETLEYAGSGSQGGMHD
jgi:hypothetical protein